MTTRSERTFCRVCTASCGLIVDVESDAAGERVVKVRGDADHPVSKGYACVKGRALGQMHHHPDALGRPRIRKGDALVETSWEHCLDDVARRLERAIERKGPSGVGMFYGTGTGTDAAAYTAAERLQNAIGTKQRYSQMTIDGVAKALVSDLVGGFPGLNPRPDLENLGLLIYAGINPAISHGHIVATPDPVRWLRKLQERAEVWVIDPRRSETARHATRHLAPKPGTDFALFAYLARELLRAGMDAEYVAAFTTDLDRLRESVEPFAAERAAQITGLSTRELEQLLAAVRRAGRVAIETGTGITMSKAANVTQWLSWVVMILTGSFNRAGGVWFHPGFIKCIDAVDLPISPPGGRRGPGPKSRPELSRFLGDYPCAALPDEIAAGHVEAFLNLGGNMVSSLPDTSRLVPALRKLDAFVSFDIIAGETTELSTHVLPVKDQLERPDVAIWDFISRDLDTQYTPAVVGAQGERRAMWWVLKEIGRRLGHELFPELGPSATDDDVLALRVRHARSSFEAMQRERYVRFDGAREDGWVDRHFRRLGGLRLAPELLTLQLASFASLEVEPLVLVPRRQARHLNAQLRYLGDRPEIMVHPDDARRAGLEHGAEVWVRSAYGALRGPVRIDASVRHGVVSVPHGYGDTDTNVNQLTSKDDVDPITGMPWYSGTEVFLAPASRAEGLSSGRSAVPTK